MSRERLRTRTSWQDFLMNSHFYRWFIDSDSDLSWASTLKGGLDSYFLAFSTTVLSKSAKLVPPLNSFQIDADTKILGLNGCAFLKENASFLSICDASASRAGLSQRSAASIIHSANDLCRLFASNLLIFHNFEITQYEVVGFRNDIRTILYFVCHSSVQVSRRK